MDPALKRATDTVAHDNLMTSGVTSIAHNAPADADELVSLPPIQPSVAFPSAASTASVPASSDAASTAVPAAEAQQPQQQMSRNMKRKHDREQEELALRARHDPEMKLTKKQWSEFKLQLQLATLPEETLRAKVDGRLGAHAAKMLAERQKQHAPQQQQPSQPQHDSGADANVQTVASEGSAAVAEAADGATPMTDAPTTTASSSSGSNSSSNAAATAAADSTQSGREQGDREREREQEGDAELTLEQQATALALRFSGAYLTAANANGSNSGSSSNGSSGVVNPNSSNSNNSSGAAGGRTKLTEKASNRSAGVVTKPMWYLQQQFERVILMKAALDKADGAHTATDASATATLSPGNDAYLPMPEVPPELLGLQEVLTPAGTRELWSPDPLTLGGFPHLSTYSADATGSAGGAGSGEAKQRFQRALADNCNMSGGGVGGVGFRTKMARVFAPSAADAGAGGNPTNTASVGASAGVSKGGKACGGATLHALSAATTAAAAAAGGGSNASDAAATGLSGGRLDPSQLSLTEYCFFTLPVNDPLFASSGDSSASEGTDATTPMTDSDSASGTAPASASTPATETALIASTSPGGKKPPVPTVTLRGVWPYLYQYRARSKSRWIGSTVKDVLLHEFAGFNLNSLKFAVSYSRIIINNKPVIWIDEGDDDAHDSNSSNNNSNSSGLTSRPRPEFGPCGSPTQFYRWRNGDLFLHHVHKHEPAVVSLPVPLEGIDWERGLVTVNKPSGIPVHACGKFLFNSVIHLLAKEQGLYNLHVVHRLDRPTSGLLIFAFDSASSDQFSKLMRNREVRKHYVARVKGRFGAHISLDERECERQQRRLLQGFVDAGSSGAQSSRPVQRLTVAESDAMSAFLRVLWIEKSVATARSIEDKILLTNHGGALTAETLPGMISNSASNSNRAGAGAGVAATVDAASAGAGAGAGASARGAIVPPRVCWSTLPPRVQQLLAQHCIVFANASPSRESSDASSGRPRSPLDESDPYTATSTLAYGVGPSLRGRCSSCSLYEAHALPCPCSLPQLPSPAQSASELEAECCCPQSEEHSQLHSQQRRQCLSQLARSAVLPATWATLQEHWELQDKARAPTPGVPATPPSSLCGAVGQEVSEGVRVKKLHRPTAVNSVSSTTGSTTSVTRGDKANAWPWLPHSSEAGGSAHSPEAGAPVWEISVTLPVATASAKYGLYGAGSLADLVRANGAAGMGRAAVVQQAKAAHNVAVAAIALYAKNTAGGTAGGAGADAAGAGAEVGAVSRRQMKKQQQMQKLQQKGQVKDASSGSGAGSGSGATAAAGSGEGNGDGDGESSDGAGVQQLLLSATAGADCDSAAASASLSAVFAPTDSPHFSPLPDASGGAGAPDAARLIMSRLASLPLAEPKPALTLFRLLSYDPVTDTSLVHCVPCTGRTHQIRVHLLWLGHPIGNDERYGGGQSTAECWAGAEDLAPRDSTKAGAEAAQAISGDSALVTANTTDAADAADADATTTCTAATATAAMTGTMAGATVVPGGGAALSDARLRGLWRQARAPHCLPCRDITYDVWQDRFHFVRSPPQPQTLAQTHSQPQQQSQEQQHALNGDSANVASASESARALSSHTNEAGSAEAEFARWGPREPPTVPASGCCGSTFPTASAAAEGDVKDDSDCEQRVDRGVIPAILPVDPFREMIWLHALKYEGQGWAYQVKLPQWGRAYYQSARRAQARRGAAAEASVAAVTGGAAVGDVAAGAEGTVNLPAYL